MRNFYGIVMASTLSLLAPVAMADFYVAGAYTLNKIDFGDGNEVDPTTLYGSFGKKLNQNISVEGRIGLGLTDDTISNVDVEITDYFGAYVKAGLPSGNFYPYAILGLTNIKVEAGSTDDTGRDLSYGIGAEFNIGNNNSLTAEYMYVYSDDPDFASKMDITGLSFGFKHAL